MERVEVASYSRINKVSNKKTQTGVKFSRTMAQQCALYIIAFMLGRACIISNVAPFGVAFFCANLDKRNKVTNLWIGLCSVLGAITTGGFMYSLKYVMAICAVVAIDMLVDLHEKQLVLKAAICSIASFVMFMAYTYINGMLSFDILISSIEAFLVFVLAYIFSIFIGCFRENNKVSFNKEEVISIVITLSLGLIALDKLSIANIKIQNIVAMFIIMIVSYYGEGADGAAAGAFLGLVLNISDQLAPTAIGIWAFAGLIAGVLKGFKKIGVSCGFVVGWILINGYTGFDNKIIYSSLDVLISLILFISLPDKILEKWVSTLKPVSKEKADYDKKISSRSVAERLKEFSGAYNLLSTQFLIMNKDESSKTDNERLNAMLDNVAQNVCVNCPGYTTCYKTDFYRTYKMLFELINSAQYRGCIEKNIVPQWFKERCGRWLDAFVKELNYSFNLYKVNLIWEKRLDEAKEIMSKQLNEVSETIDHMAEYVNSNVKVQVKLKDMISAELSNGNIKYEELEVYKDSNGILNIEIGHRGCMGRLKCENHIMPLIHNVVSSDFVKYKEGCMIDKESGTCYLRLVEKPKFTFETAQISIAKNIGGVCGDYARAFQVNAGKTVMILSDGMGTGIKAFNQSNASVEAMEGLIRSGFENNVAAKLVNSILVVGDKNDNFATLDMCNINMYTGDIEFSKVGAAPSYIKRKNKVEYINSDTLPAGIMDDIDFKLEYKHLEDGDAIILISDGVIDNGDGLWLKRYINRLQITDPEMAAKAIIDVACENFKGELSDDMTVIVGIFKEGE